MSATAPKSPTILLALFTLIIVPLLIWLEKVEPKVWVERLLSPDGLSEGPRHQPLVTDGIFLPPVILENMTLTKAMPVIIPGVVRVPKGITLRIEEGTTVFVHEYGQLLVEGELIAVGTETNPLHFTTNETHVANQTWAGIVFAPQSKGTITDATFHHASPTITCGKESVVALNHATITLGNLGIYTESVNCRIQNSLIEHVTNGVIGIGFTPVVIATTINAKNEKVQEFSVSAP
ncbi:MAG: hypothetical protein HYR90_04900 [Candidatus Andersenbacteria bacterium]|nr:hypothetical protein [Candidatus Andersenbacteria bacterium]MBI3250773.1 hypothetical protein [Candidatus Andersenbacteria bacterium]